MMRLFLPVVAGILFLYSANVYADWQYTKWGMSPDEVIIASEGKATANDLVKNESIADYAELVKSNYTTGRLKFRVVFLFDKITNKLDVVRLELIEPLLVGRLFDALSSKYGEPVDHIEIPSIKYTEWIDKFGNNNITLFQLFGGVSVLYEPIVSSEASGL